MIPLVIFLLYLLMLALWPSFDLWLKRSYLRIGRFAEFAQWLHTRLRAIGLASSVTLPALEIELITSRELPTGFKTRVWTPADTQACMELHRLNASERFPADDKAVLAKTLETGTTSMMVIENEGRVVACGGLRLRQGQVTLFYGLVHPEFQGRSIGRLLLLSRLARLAITDPVCVSIHAVEASIGYYERFGFMRYALWKAADGSTHPTAGVSLSAKDREVSVLFLSKYGYSCLPAVDPTTVG